MKIWVPILLLILCCHDGHPVYEFHLKTLAAPSEFDNNLKLAADLNSELVQGLNKLYLGSHVNNNESPETLDEQNINPYERDADSSENLSDPAPNDEITVDDSEITDEVECSNPEADNEPENASSDGPPTVAEIENFVGSNLFDGNRKKCFSLDDVALLAARRDFEYLIPKGLPQCLFSENMVTVLMQYFHGASQLIQRMPDDSSKRLSEKAFYDMLGGYLKYYIVPVTKYSFYAGKLCLETVQKVLALQLECKKFLNTNGNGWRPPIGDVLTDLKNIQIEPLKMGSDEDSSDQPSSCMNLDLTSVNGDGDDEQMIVSLPKLEPEDSDGYLGNIWLPFNRKHIFNLRSPKSMGIVVKFYETVSCCYQFQSISQSTYNRLFKSWILENIQVHLCDDQFYPGLGSILQIYENLRRGKKAIIFEGLMDKKPPDDGENNDDDDEPEEDNTDNGNDDDDKVVVNKRHNNEEYYEVAENSAKQMSGNSDSWLQFSDEYYNEENSLKSRKDCVKKPATTCMPITSNVPMGGMAGGKEASAKPTTNSYTPSTVITQGKNNKTKSKSKSKTKTKSKSHKMKSKSKKKKKPKQKSKNKTKSSNKTSKFMFGDIMRNDYTLYACYGLAGVLCMVLFCMLCVLLMRLARRRLECGSKYQHPPPECPPCPEPFKPRRSLCDCLRRKKKKKPEDEEVLIKPETTSVLPPSKTPETPRQRQQYSPPIKGEKANFPTTSSSSVTCKPKKWLPYKRGGKKSKGSEKSSAPNSFEYSSSEPEEVIKPRTKKKPPPPPKPEQQTPPSPRTSQSPPKKVQIDDFRSCDCDHSPRRGCKNCFNKKKSAPPKSNDPSPTGSPRELQERSNKSDAKSSV